MFRTIKSSKLIAIITIFLLMMSIFALLLNSLVKAQDVYENMQEGGSLPLPAGVTPDLTAETVAFLSFRPNPVGVNQPILVNMWVTPALHVSRYLSDYTITITKPDGTEDVVVIDSYRADATGWFEYVPDQVGEWTLKFEFPGGYFPAGNYTIFEGAYETRNQAGDVIYEFTESCYYTPSATQEQTLTVQQDIVYSWPESPLPNDYWTRPVSPEHREWWLVLGCYPGNGVVGGGPPPYWPADTNIYGGSMADNEFYPYVQGPNSAHVLWKRQEGIGGLIGGPAGIQTDTDPSSSPDLIYAGRCYDTMTVLKDGVPTTCAVCYDLRTGEIYYAIPTSEGGYTPNYVSYIESSSYEVPGATERSTYSVTLFSLGSTLRKINAETGSVSEYPGMSGEFYKDPYVLSVQNLGGGNYRLINWTVDGNSDNFADRVVSNITWPWSNLGHSVDYESMIAVITNRVEPPAMAAYYESELIAADLLIGEELWSKTVDDIIYSSSCTVADHGKVAAVTMAGTYKAWDLRTGNVAWESPKMDYPWSAAGFGAYDATSAYGMLYRQAYDGVYAFDWDDGSIVWHYISPSEFAYETPYTDKDGNGVYSFNSGAKVADGKVFTYNSEHTTTQPITRGWRIHCIDAYTGEEVWSLATPMRPGAIADGYLTADCDWQSTMYVIGKGKSQTTVTAPDVAVPKGTATTIKGSILDQSPAQAGTPCVSQDSMSIQMEYLHLQRPIDGIHHNETITGVPVSLTAIAEDGTFVDIGTTTTDGYTGKYGLAWIPEQEGTYKIIASFEGDESYGSSSDTTFVTVGPSTSPDIPIQPATEASPITTITIVAAVAIIAIVGASAYLTLRRRK